MLTVILANLSPPSNSKHSSLLFARLFIQRNSLIKSYIVQLNFTKKDALYTYRILLCKI